MEYNQRRFSQWLAVEEGREIEFDLLMILELLAFGVTPYFAN